MPLGVPFTRARQLKLFPFVLVLTSEMGPDRRQFVNSHRASMVTTTERHWPQRHPHPRYAVLVGPAAADPYHSVGLRVS